MMSLREKVKEMLGTLCGIGLLILLLAIYNVPNFIIPKLELVYLRHLATKEEAANKKVEAAFTVNPCTADQQIGSFTACMNKFNNDFKKAWSEKSAIHERRLRLEVKWGLANSPEDVRELGWNYPRAEWDGNKWACPVGTNPYSIDTEKQAGAVEYAHCLSEKEAAGQVK